ncbi:PDR/VanB family oxidoreductase [Streptomyces sp. NPDC102360]|uniref:PDR/VanB family oxidoreductase n=1 Tax=Streptomyces sp. NPDC102360 TaxID=3366160 RepID=UPI003800A9E2
MSVAVQVSEIVEESAAVRSLRLRRADGAAFGPFAAGAHIDVTGPTGVLRQYSLAGDPADRSSVLIAVKREDESRGGSAALHRAAVGDELTIGPPRNLLGIAEGADRHLLVAGGIGVTPLLSMAYELHRRGADFALHYFVRSRAELAFGDLLERRAEFRDRVTLHIGRPREEQPGILRPSAATLSAASHVYTCGPVGFMDQVTAVFAPVVGEAQVHVEHFSAEPVDTSDDTPFTVELDTGEEFEVPADRTILSVLEEAGIPVGKSCEEGICGSCVSGLLEGTADHRDHCLSAAEHAAGTEIALCVSRARSERLRIELY